MTVMKGNFGFSAHELSKAILADDLSDVTDRALEALEEIAHVDMEQFPTDESIAAWEKVNAEIGRRQAAATPKVVHPLLRPRVDNVRVR